MYDGAGCHVGRSGGRYMYAGHVPPVAHVEFLAVNGRAPASVMPRCACSVQTCVNRQHS